MMISNLIFPYDHIISIIILLIIIFSFIRGFIQSILSLLTWVGSILITIYSYKNISEYIVKNLLDVNFFQNYEYLTNITTLILSIPLIFIISLFILKRIRKYLSSDIDGLLIGKILDKFFGMIYGIVFSYVILTSCNILVKNFNYNSLENWLNNNSNIISSINKINENYIFILQKINKKDEI